MQNVICMNVGRICNKVYNDNWKLTLKDFELKHLQDNVMPRKMVDMSDVFIVTDDLHFKIIKCRLPEFPNGQLLPLSYLKYTCKLIQEYQNR